MKYFLHDASSFDDEKVTELFLKFGYEGVGLFYTILEKFAKQEKPIKTSVLKAQLKVGKRLEKCWKFMEEIGMIQSLNGDSFNERLLNYGEMYQIKKENTRKKVAEWRKNQTNIKTVTSYVPVSNHLKVKLSKVKENKYNNIPPTFEEVNNRIKERNIIKFTAETFIAHYNSNGWMVGKNKMKDWDSAITTWNSKKYDDGFNRQHSGRHEKSVNAMWDKEN